MRKPGKMWQELRLASKLSWCLHLRNKFKGQKYVIYWVPKQLDYFMVMTDRKEIRAWLSKTAESGSKQWKCTSISLQSILFLIPITLSMQNIAPISKGIKGSLLKYEWPWPRKTYLGDCKYHVSICNSLMTFYIQRTRKVFRDYTAGNIR